jgi:hypothetical protein
LKIVENTYIAIDFLENAMVNKIMGTATVNEDDDLPILNLAIDIKGLGSIEDTKGMQ